MRGDDVQAIPRLSLSAEMVFQRLFGQFGEALDVEVLNNSGAAFVAGLSSICFERANDSGSQGFGVLGRHDDAAVANEQRRVADIRDDAGDTT